MYILYKGAGPYSQFLRCRRKVVQIGARVPVRVLVILYNLNQGHSILVELLNCFVPGQIDPLGHIPSKLHVMSGCSMDRDRTAGFYLIWKQNATIASMHVCV